MSQLRRIHLPCLLLYASPKGGGGVREGGVKGVRHRRIRSSPQKSAIDRHEDAPLPVLPLQASSGLGSRLVVIAAKGERGVGKGGVQAERDEDDVQVRGGGGWE